MRFADPSPEKRQTNIDTHRFFLVIVLFCLDYILSMEIFSCLMSFSLMCCLWVTINIMKWVLISFFVAFLKIGVALSMLSQLHDDNNPKKTFWGGGNIFPWCGQFSLMKPEWPSSKCSSSYWTWNWTFLTSEREIMYFPNWRRFILSHFHFILTNWAIVDFVQVRKTRWIGTLSTLVKGDFPVPPPLAKNQNEKKCEGTNQRLF